jgi:hypothetical protein
MMCAMSAPKDSERPPRSTRSAPRAASAETSSVFAQLPRTRPQRSTARRAAARKATAAAPKRSVKPVVSAEPAPRQGFESDGERTGGSVHPPGGAELVASAVEIVGELAKVGISTGERLLKDVISRLPLS